MAEHVSSMVGACEECRKAYPTQIEFANAVIKAAKEMYSDGLAPFGGRFPFAHLVSHYEAQYGGVTLNRDKDHRE